MPLWILCTGNERERRSKVTGERIQKKENNAHYLYILKPSYRKLHIHIQTDQFAKMWKLSIGSSLNYVSNKLPPRGAAKRIRLYMWHWRTSRGQTPTKPNVSVAERSGI